MKLTTKLIFIAMLSVLVNMQNIVVASDGTAQYLVDAAAKDIHYIVAGNVLCPLLWVYCAVTGANELIHFVEGPVLSTTFTRKQVVTARVGLLSVWLDWSKVTAAQARPRSKKPHHCSRK